MKRFMTALVCDKGTGFGNDIYIAFEDGDPRLKTFDDDYAWHETIWQFAPDAETAIKPHE